MKRTTTINNEPVTEATRLWDRFGFENTAELVLEDLAMTLGVLVFDGALNSADAWLLRKGERGLIRVSDAIREPGRRRFAIAHELGHWTLHQSVTQLASCTTEDMVARYQGSSPEVEANVFAAELLMPRHLFLPAIEAQPTAKLINELADRFETSRTSTSFRITELTSRPFLIVLSKAGEVKWWQASSALQNEIWIRQNKPVPESSVAGKVFAGQAPPSQPSSVPLNDWLTRNNTDAESVYEDVIAMPDYDQVLSLLWLDD